MTKYANTGLLFNKHYYKEIQYLNPEEDNFDYKKDKTNKSKLEDNNEILFRSSLNNTLEPMGNKKFELTTTYPGLFLGSGYPHEAGIEGELKLGFFFDYATGIPILPGSSVKGVLRSAFEVANGEYAKYLLQNEMNIDDNMISKLFDYKVKVEGIKGEVPYIIASIFHGYSPVKKDDTIICKQSNVYKRDIFFDALPYGKVLERKFLANDYITPHENPLKNPVPLQFLKVLPGVTFRFDFKLIDLIDENGNKILTAEEKKELFRLILLDLGIGAKTNVGYGQFEDEDANLLLLRDLKIGDKIECQIKDAIYRENDNKYQIYLLPKIKDYETFLEGMKKPLPSIRIEKYLKKHIEVSKDIICEIKSFSREGRVLFKDEFENL